MIRIRRQGALSTIPSLRMRVGGVLRTIRAGRVMEDEQLRTFWLLANPLATSISPPDIYAPGTTAVITSGVVLAQVSGGTGPFSYQWTCSNSSISVLSPNLASTQFRSPVLGPGGGAGGNVNLTVTDSLGATAHASAPLTFERF